LCITGRAGGFFSLSDDIGFRNVAVGEGVFDFSDSISASLLDGVNLFATGDDIIL
jgi:hypothetical protein